MITGFSTVTIIIFEKLNIDWSTLRSLMDPIFEPIFDFSENMAGYPCLLLNFVNNSLLLVSFSKPQTYWDGMLHREPVSSLSHMLLSYFQGVWYF